MSRPSPERGLHRPGPSATEPDWTRERKTFWAWDPSRSLLASLRAYQRHAGSRKPRDVLLRKVAVLRHRFWSIVTGADIPLNSRVGGGLEGAGDAPAKVGVAPTRIEPRLTSYTETAPCTETR